jgi:hypothetical protein
MRKAFAGLCVLIAALAAGSAAALPQTPQPSPAARNSAEVIAGMQSFWRDLKTYQVPVSLSGSVRVAFISVPFKAEGTEYYRAPNQQALHLDGAPSMARSFQTTVASMGSPQTWPLNYTMTLHGTQTNHNHLAYVLSGPPKKQGSTVKTITMLVAAKTFVVETVTFSYQNGSVLTLDFSHHGPSPYHLPTSIAVTAKFPSYSGSARLVYGTYETNVAIPASAFAQPGGSS